MTGLPASIIGMVDRGFIAAGMAADLTVFDPATVIDRATYDRPSERSEGIRFVVVNGGLALRDGEPTVARTLQRFRSARDFLVRELNAIPGVEAPPPAGAMYAFFRAAGITDSLAFCKALVHEAKLGLAPGIAFGPEGEGYFRWCFAAGDARLHDGLERLRKFLQTCRTTNS